MMESFWGTMQLELLDSKTWQTREELANAMFEWIECWYNTKRRHSGIGMRSPATFEALHTGSDQTDWPHTAGVRATGGTSPPVEPGRAPAPGRSSTFQRDVMPPDPGISGMRGLGVLRAWWARKRRGCHG